MAYNTLKTILLSLFVLLLTIDPVSAYYYGYYNTWYIYVIVVFVIVAVSSCIGACVRHRRNQLFLEQQRELMNQGITIQTSRGATNQGFYPTYDTTGGQYPAPPAGGLIQQPPPYGSTTNTQEKDPNMPPAYEEAILAPSAGQGATGNPPYPTVPGGATSPPPPAPPAGTTAPPYPTQPAPYPTQPAPYPTQPAPYPTQQPAYPPPAGAPPS